MSNLASPLQLGLIAAAVSWPFAAGLGVVLWSKARAATQAEREAALSGRLRSLYRSVEARPLSPKLRLTVEAIEEQEAMAAAAMLGAAARKRDVPAT